MATELISLKITVIGDGDIGKTCMVRRFTSARKDFDNSYEPTVFDYSERIRTYDNKNIKMCIWDTAGQVSYGRLLPLTLVDSDFVIILFSIDNWDSYENVSSNWKQEIMKLEKQPKLIPVASKVDLRNDIDTISRLAKDGRCPLTNIEGYKMKEEIKASAYFECSAKMNYGINEIFDYIAKDALGIYYRENRCSSCKIYFTQLFDKSPQR